jgi:arylsulfatase A-like enzyme
MLAGTREECYGKTQPPHAGGNGRTMKTRRDMLSWSAMGITTLALPRSAWPADAAEAKRPNVLFLLTDDQRPDTIGALGNRFIKTPNLDRLADRSVAFRNAYCFGAYQGAVCVPSRAQILTGLNLFRLKGKIQNLSDTDPCQYAATFARTMKAAGYATMRSGKLGSTPPKLYTEFDKEYTIARGPTCGAQHADHAIGLIREHAGKKPFFACLEFATPHDPQPAPQEYYAMYRPEDLPLPPSFLPFHPFDNGEMTVRDEQTLPWPRTRESVTGKLARYYSSITYTDAQIGRVLKALEESGQKDNTIIIFASDNGLSLGDHGLLGKQNLYEFGGMHVPLMIAGPGVPPGRTEALAYLYDIFPTVCELANIAVPHGLDGQSLAPVVQGKKPKVRDYAFTCYRDVQRAVRDDRWKLIRYPKINKTQLFDLHNDPHEMDDLASKPEQAERVRELMTKLAELQRQYGDSAKLTVENPMPAEWTPDTAKGARAAGGAGKLRRQGAKQQVEWTGGVM